MQTGGGDGREHRERRVGRSAAVRRRVRGRELLEHGDAEQEHVAEQHAEVLAREQEQHTAARLAVRQHCDQLGHLHAQSECASPSSSASYD